MFKIKAEPVKRFSDYQKNWSSVIDPLRPGRFTIQETQQLSIHGDAPKCFIRIKEHVEGRSNAKLRRWPGYIAKVGSKNYPVESITEHLMTRIGQAFGLTIADSKLLMVAGQVRFLSKFFRSKKESLVHGLEIFRRYLDDDEFVDQVADEKREKDFYTFQTVIEAIKDIYPEHLLSLMTGMVELLAFDAVVGNNDRHPMNWGVIVPVTQSNAIRFAPIFDTARGLFWNLEDAQLPDIADSEIRLTAYTNKSRPQLGWDGGCPKLSHFELIRLIHQNYPEYRNALQKFTNLDRVSTCARIIHGEFANLMSDCRRNAICRCLEKRHERFCEAVV